MTENSPIFQALCFMAATQEAIGDTNWNSYDKR
jgi:hypothetical protein